MLISGGRKPVSVSVMDEKTKKSRSKEALELREQNEPSMCEETFVPPSDLSKGALKEWRRVVRLYRQLDRRVLNDLDQTTLAAYCESTAVYKDAQNKYQSLPLVDPDSGKENPYLKIMWREGANIAKYAEQLCLSPVGRARMGVLAAKREMESDSTAEFFAKYGS